MEPEEFFWRGSLASNTETRSDGEIKGLDARCRIVRNKMLAALIKTGSWNSSFLQWRKPFDGLAAPSPQEVALGCAELMDGSLCSQEITLTAYFGGG